MLLISLGLQFPVNQVNKNTERNRNSWTIVNISDKNCNPGLLGIVGAGSTVDPTQMGFDKEGIIGLIVWVACVLYSSLRSASKSSKITMSEHVLVKDNGAGEKIIDFLVFSDMRGYF